MSWFLVEAVPTWVGARILGHGRALESFLALVALSYGSVVLVFPGAAWDSQAVRDLFWIGKAQIIAAPLLLQSILSLYGLTANIKGWPRSRTARFLGAFLGCGIWIWFLAKFILYGTTFTIGSFFAFFAFLYSIRIMAMALADLPRPGSPGTL